MRPNLEKSFTKIELVEWFKMKAMSSSPSTTHKRKKKKTDKMEGISRFYMSVCFLGRTSI
jgi:hypothetical protein